MTLPPFQRVLDEHGPAVYRYLAACGGAEADDCYQETVLAALRSYGSLRHAQHLRAWLFTIANHKLVDAHRARSRRPLPVGQGPDSIVAMDDLPGVDGEPELWARVRRLPPKQRDAVVLRYVADLAHAEVGAVLGCSADAARRSVHEGIKRLREELS